MTETEIYGIFVVIAIFFAIRHIICWYFKLNKLVEQNEKIIELLSTIVNSKATTPYG